MRCNFLDSSFFSFYISWQVITDYQQQSLLRDNCCCIRGKERITAEEICNHMSLDEKENSMSKHNLYLLLSCSTDQGRNPFSVAYWLSLWTHLMVIIVKVLSNDHSIPWVSYHSSIPAVTKKSGNRGRCH